MNLDCYTAPSQYVKFVICELEKRLNLTIESAFKRESEEIEGAQICYHTGEVESGEGYANDGRKQHEIELRFLVYVPLSSDDFELEALDLSCRIERELLDETFDNGSINNISKLISNTPRKFSPETAFFLRVVVIKQVIRMGPLEQI